MALQGVGFAALGAFLATYFAHRGWSFGSLGLTCFGCAFVLCRAFFGHLPDRIGGLRVAGISLMVEAVGQFLIFMAPSPVLALCGATLTGMGCSMIYPSLGVEVVKSVPASARATALGGFAAFQDLSYAVTSPFAGIVADHYGYRAIFLSGTFCALIALITVGTMQARQLRTLETGGNNRIIFLPSEMSLEMAIGRCKSFTVWRPIGRHCKRRGRWRHRNPHQRRQIGQKHNLLLR